MILLIGQWACTRSPCPTAHDVQIQRALDTAAARGGGTVELPAGVFETCQALILGSNVHLRGAGRGATVIRGSAMIWGGTVEGAYIGASIGGAGVENVSVSDLTVDHRTHSRNANGISFVPTGADYTGTVPRNVLVERVEVLGAPDGYHNYLIWNLRGQHVKIRDNWLDGGYTVPKSVSPPQEGIESYGGHDVLITGNTVRNIGYACINLGSAGIPQSETVGLMVSQNNVSGCNIGINIGTSNEAGGQNNTDSHVFNNIITHTASFGIDVVIQGGTAEHNLHLVGNTVRLIGPADLAAGIRISGQKDAQIGMVTIARNHIEAVIGPNGHGIRVLFSRNVRVLDNTIVNTSGEGVYGYASDNLEVSRNRVERPGLYGLYLGPSAERLVVVGNLIADWPPASPGILLEGIRHAAVRGNLFHRSDQAQPSPIGAVVSCGVQMTDNQALYAGPTANLPAVPCR